MSSRWAPVKVKSCPAANHRPTPEARAADAQNGNDHQEGLQAFPQDNRRGKHKGQSRAKTIGFHGLLGFLEEFDALGGAFLDELGGSSIFDGTAHTAHGTFDLGHQGGIMGPELHFNGLYPF
jgi:hypothetical protein